MKQLLRGAFGAAVSAADAATRVPPHLPPPPARRLVVVGAGKAAGPMARAVVRHYAASHPASRLTGLLIAPHVGGAPSRAGSASGHYQSVRVLGGSHPVPDEAGLRATQQILALVHELGPGDLLLVLLSGGGSALLTAPAGISLASKAELTRRLLASGADIGEVNTVRKHLSHVKGGRLALLARERGAEVLTLAISDVVGDDPSTIASGPTVADPTTYGEALELVERHAPGMRDVRRALQRGVAGLVEETPKPGDERLAAARFVLVADPHQGLQAAGATLQRAGVEVENLGAGLVGEAREVGARHAALLAQRLQGRTVTEGPWALLSGGELTVTLAGETGVGGPNGEYALGLAAALADTGAAEASAWQLYVLAADTDGVDGGGGGSGGGAGALLGPNELAQLTGLSVREALRQHASHELLRQVGGLLTTGATETNLNDLRIVLAVPAPR